MRLIKHCTLSILEFKAHFRACSVLTQNFLPWVSHLLNPRPGPNILCHTHTHKINAFHKLEIIETIFSDYNAIKL